METPPRTYAPLIHTSFLQPFPSTMHLPNAHTFTKPLSASKSRGTVVRVHASTQAAVAPAAKGSGQPRNQLEALKLMSSVVADTGEPALVAQFKPEDCTTNPSLVYKAIQSEKYAYHLRDAMAQRQKLKDNGSGRPYAGVADALCVNLGAEMLQIVPGRVSTEVDAFLSHDTKATVDKALHLVDLYAAKGIDARERVYIKIASTWEGIEACRILEKQGIRCNMTLLFSFAQAAACADAGATLISPFVGRILDWYKKKEGREYASHEDPGVLSVQKTYAYFKTNKFPTVVMAASFRNIGEIRELAGCDKITISPQLLAELEASTEPLPRKLSPETAKYDGGRLAMSKALFDELHNADQMAVDKLKEGIEGFAKDQKGLEDALAALA